MAVRQALCVCGPAWGTNRADCSGSISDISQSFDFFLIHLTKKEENKDEVSSKSEDSWRLWIVLSSLHSVCAWEHRENGNDTRMELRKEEIICSLAATHSRALINIELLFHFPGQRKTRNFCKFEHWLERKAKSLGILWSRIASAPLKCLTFCVQIVGEEEKKVQFPIRITLAQSLAQISSLNEKVDDDDGSVCCVEESKRGCEWPIESNR